jgi:uncharacterized membrane protein YkoI
MVQNPATNNHNVHDTSPIDKEVAIAIAKQEVAKGGRSFDEYRIEVSDRTDAWHVEFHLKDLTAKGGSSEFLISKETGEILQKKLYQ